jgi:integrase
VATFAATASSRSQPEKRAHGLRQLFAFAKRKGYINEIPELRIKSARPNARPDIPDAEWKRLCDYLPLFVDKAQDKRRQRERYYLVLYILILANTGIRIGEARKLQWRDISSTRTLTGETRAVLTVRGKTGERETVCNIGVDRFLAELKSFRTADLTAFHLTTSISSVVGTAHRSAALRLGSIAS